MVVDIESQDWEQCCRIIDSLEDIGDTDIIECVVQILCNVSKEAMNCEIGQYGEEVLGDDE